VALCDSRWFRRSFCGKKSSLAEMLAARCGWRIASNLSKPPSNLPKLSHWMVLWFSETRTAAQGLWMTFKPGMELYLEANAIVEIKWGDQGGVCEGGQLPSSQDQ
jgi:hypothetical protein